MHVTLVLVLGPSVNGQASVILSAGLGPINPPVHPYGHHGLPPRHHRGPAYHRRQEQQRAAREAADQTPSVEELDDVIPAAQAEVEIYYYYY
jgi:hypothetical protein